MTTSQSSENALANSQQHSSTSRSAKRPRPNHEPQQDKAEGERLRVALGATKRISVGDRRFGSAARVAHARARGLDILQNCHGAKSRGRKNMAVSGRRQHEEEVGRQGRLLRNLGSPHIHIFSALPKRNIEQRLDLANLDKLTAAEFTPARSLQGSRIAAVTLGAREVSIFFAAL